MMQNFMAELTLLLQNFRNFTVICNNSLMLTNFLMLLWQVLEDCMVQGTTEEISLAHWDPGSNSLNTMKINDGFYCDLKQHTYLGLSAACTSIV